MNNTSKHSEQKIGFAWFLIKIKYYHLCKSGGGGGSLIENQYIDNKH